MVGNRDEKLVISARLTGQRLVLNDLMTWIKKFFVKVQCSSANKATVNEIRFFMLRRYQWASWSAIVVVAAVQLQTDIQMLQIRDVCLSLSVFVHVSKGALLLQYQNLSRLFR